MPVIGNYVSGQILYAANLNNSFLQSAAIAGDAFTGTITAPNVNVTNTAYAKILIVNNAITLTGLDLGSRITNAYNTANAAFATANSSNSSLNTVLIQNIYNATNGAFITANNALPKTGGVVTGTITLNSTLNASNTITGNTEIQGTANSVVYPAQFRAIQGNYGAIIRNDGINFYLLTTSNVGLSSAGTSNFNGLRPFYFNLSNGAVTIDGTGSGTIFGGAVTSTSLTAGTANIAAIRVKTITVGGNYVLLPQDSGQTIYYNNTSPITINVNNNLFPGFRAIVTQANTGTVTFQTGSGTFINPRSGTLLQITGQYASASIVSVPYATNTFILDGSIQ